jgi:hypothetical protein
MTWWSIVVVFRGERVEYALERRGAMGSWDGAVIGDREAKKAAKALGREYIKTGAPGQPRVVKSPERPERTIDYTDPEAEVFSGSDTYTSTEEFLKNNPEITLRDVNACQHALLQAVHYRPDGSCRCDDSSHVEMVQWGYTWQPALAEEDDTRGRWTR